MLKFQTVSENCVNKLSQQVQVPVVTKQTEIMMNAATIKGLDVGSQTITRRQLMTHSHLAKVLDKLPCYTAAHPRILVGQDNNKLLIARETIEGSDNDVVASRSALGWCVHGPHASLADSCVHTCRTHYDPYVDVAEIIKREFAIDSIGICSTERQNKEDVRALDILEKTSRRESDQRWESGLPWRFDQPYLPNNYNDAARRLKSVERKCLKNDEYATLYKAQITRLIEEAYASKIESVPEREPRWFLPHFGVLNPNKPGKLRLVFDAAAKTDGTSLNDQLLTGPDLLSSLLGILMRFRQKAVAFTADIKDMFLRIKMRAEDRNAQLFLWRDLDVKKEPDIYRLNTVIFGATSSPTTAQFVKNKNADEFKNRFPAACHAIRRNHYVDDYLDSVDTEEEAKQLIHDVTEVHRRGGFEIRGFVCNRPAVLNTELVEAVNLSNIEESVERTLGLLWNPKSDTLSFDVSMKRLHTEVRDKRRRPTKREFLSAAMSVFDPHGFLGPITIHAKTLLQDVWRSGIDWDDRLKDSEADGWQKWRSRLDYVERLHIPRAYDMRPGDIAELHVFADASERAYAAVAYWVFINAEDNYETRRIAFIASKSRVAPLKPMTIPRLELQAALIAARLAQTIQKEHDVTAVRRVFWTDSSTVLQWITADPRRYQTFVTQRLGEIDELTNPAEWRWVPGRDNPADLATKETSEKFEHNSKWFQGPTFLQNDESSWPVRRNPTEETSESKEELRAKVALVIEKKNKEGLISSIEKWSCWGRLIRTIARTIEIGNKWRKRAIPSLRDRMNQAEVILAKEAQENTFKAEINALRKEESIDKGSRLWPLSPYIDKEGLIRIDGRAKILKYTYAEIVEPVILDGKSLYAALLVKYYHERALHGSTEMVLNELRQKYWVTNARSVLRSIAAKCLKCRQMRAQPCPPRMGDLPLARLAHHARPFSHTGVDMFGPMEVTIGRRREKRYGMIFTCMTTWAIHLEITASLSTDSTIMAVRRMAARRGQPAHLYSDNGTNFTGADKELRRALQELKEKLRESGKIEWHFIAPAAPHMGGAWERLIRSVKRALKATLNEKTPREETLHTLITEVEHMVNSRPLTHVSPDPRDPEALTPNHFLFGSSNGAPTSGVFVADDLFLRKQWRISQRLADMFWRRWLREYMPTLLTRRKWQGETENLKIDDVVLIVDLNTTRSNWPRGRIAAVHPGKDGRVRVADIITATGWLRRPVTKLALLYREDGRQPPPAAEQRTSSSSRLQL